MIPETLKELAVPVDSLKHYTKNPRVGNVETIKESLRKNGQYRPVVVNERTGEVLAGNHTLKAARELGWTEIAATFVDVDDDHAARIVLVDNRANELATFNDEVLVEVLQELDGQLEGTGYDQSDLDDLLGQLSSGFGQPKDPDKVPQEPAEPTTRRGDIYELGPHKLLCGDSTLLDEVGELMGEDRAKMVFTDPPYGVDYDGGTKVREKLSGDHDTDIYSEVMPSLVAYSDPRAPFYIWHAYTKADLVLQACRVNGLEPRSLILWVKNQAQFGALSAQYKQKHEPCIYAHRKGHAPYWYGPNNEVTVWEADRARSNDYHPTQKPVALAERALNNSSQKGDIVLDLFGGSGSTLIGCETTGRVARVMELSPSYCDVIVARWEAFTGKKAKRIANVPGY